MNIDPQLPAALNGWAWLLATCPDEKFRAGRKAVELARQACVQTDWQSGGVLDTLAAAYAEAGQFTDAVRTQEQALADKNFAAGNDNARAQAEALSGRQSVSGKIGRALVMSELATETQRHRAAPPPKKKGFLCCLLCVFVPYSSRPFPRCFVSALLISAFSLSERICVFVTDARASDSNSSDRLSGGRKHTKRIRRNHRNYLVASLLPVTWLDSSKCPRGGRRANARKCPAC